MDLLELLEAAGKPDRDLDRAIAEAFMQRTSDGIFHASFAIGIPAFTADVDAGLNLAAMLLPPLSDIVLKTYPGGQYHHCEIETDFGEYEAHNCPTPALALLIAIVKANADQAHPHPCIIRGGAEG